MADDLDDVAEPEELEPEDLEDLGDEELLDEETSTSRSRRGTTTR